MFKTNNKYHLNNKGSVLLFILVFGAMAVMIIISGVAGYTMLENQATNRKQERDSAFHVAEAGINYYKWHLAHNQTDYQDGKSVDGPYLHEYKDKNNQIVGYYSLDITPPLVGSTIVTIESTGWMINKPDVKRTIRVRMGRPGFTDYVVMQNASTSFSNTTYVHGKVHSNTGVEFNGVTDSFVDAAQETYTDSNGSHPGVWGTGGPVEFWRFPVVPKDFNSVSVELSEIKTLSDNGGVHLYSSGKEGWHLVFKADGTFDLYKVTQRKCYYGQSWKSTCNDIKLETFVSNTAYPSNGALFSEDDLWVEGTINGRLTVAAGRFPVQASTYQEIYIADNLVYLQKNSDDVLGLIAQGNILVPFDIPSDLEIDAALLSQYGLIQRPYYDKWANPSLKNSIYVFGSQISYYGGGWKWKQNGAIVSGFVNSNLTYDANLRYYIPPGFPVDSTYEQISWEEVQ